MSSIVQIAKQYIIRINQHLAGQPKQQFDIPLKEGATLAEAENVAEAIWLAGEDVEYCTIINESEIVVKIIGKPNIRII